MDVQVQISEVGIYEWNNLSIHPQLNKEWFYRAVHSAAAAAVGGVTVTSQ